MFYPFEQKTNAKKDTVMDWNAIYPKPYLKSNIDPFTKVRIILMNTIEVESVAFSHQFHRNCQDNDLRRELAVMRRTEQQQQKQINWLKPIDETQLETTIGYEHATVALTAWLAQNEPDDYVKQTLDFALIEDFDHLYRYSNLLHLDHANPSQKLVKSYVDISPGRPTISQHRSPEDSVRYYTDFKTADIRTKLSTMIITAAEQQTMNYYMNLGNDYENELGRKLFLEIAMIEEQHVTQYGSLMDPSSTWLEKLLLHEYMECYLYDSFYEDETDPCVKSIWEMHLYQEIAHLKIAADLLYKYENKQWEQYVPAAFPPLLQFCDTRNYIRSVLAEQIELTADKESLVNMSEIPSDHSFFAYQSKMNHSIDTVASHLVIVKHVQEYKEDYRAESKPNPVYELSDRIQDNTDLARTKQSTFALL